MKKLLISCTHNFVIRLSLMYDVIRETAVLSALYDNAPVMSGQLSGILNKASLILALNPNQSSLVVTEFKFVRRSSYQC